ncbi:MAG: hypothetical protein H9791_05130 [Candidatus Bacteroides intestinipullorum]|uniref:Uncharacterized protein n=1 Tax=Candidatus Bacteroides intestinipullorum TaxID=2838471 RepID=A0A9E2KEX7_9BACE|nr:hypothetical protein [Candidatus Bacteroides intestinipullorum]
MAGIQQSGGPCAGKVWKTDTHFGELIHTPPPSRQSGMTSRPDKRQTTIIFWVSYPKDFRIGLLLFLTYNLIPSLSSPSCIDFQKNQLSFVGATPGTCKKKLEKAAKNARLSPLRIWSSQTLCLPLSRQGRDTAKHSLAEPPHPHFPPPKDEARLVRTRK